MVAKKVYLGVDKLFGSKTRAKLLGLFLNNEKKSFYVREITRLVDEQVNSVRRELANLHNLGVLKSDTYDGKLYYAVNKSYPYFGPLKTMFASDAPAPGNKSESDSKWDMAIKPVRELLEVLMVADPVTGSGVADMLVVGKDLDGRLSKWASVIEKKIGRDLRYIVLPVDEFYYRLSAKDQFVTAVVQSDLKVVVDRKNTFKKGE
jgi:hypothetical protein